MTNEQILWLARVRVGLQRANVLVDLVRATRDRPYLEAVLSRATELHDETAVEASMKLMSQLGLINGARVMDPARDQSITRPLDSVNGFDPFGSHTLRSGIPFGVPDSSQSDPAPIEPGRFSTPIGTTTGTSPAPVAGGKSYKRGLR
jgi:hypothetical protein